MQYRIQAGQLYTASKSKHDNLSLNFSFANSNFDNCPTNIEATFFELKETLLALASQEIQDKDKISGLMPCNWYDKPVRQLIWDNASADQKSKILATHPNFNPLVDNNKSELFANQRSLLIFDFDKDNAIDLDFIHKLFEQFVYIAYTTHSHGINGNRYRVILPLKQQLTTFEWAEWAKTTVAQFVLNSNIVNDSSSLTFAQFQKFPAINPAVGYCEVVINDKDTCELFDVFELERVEAPKQQLFVENNINNNVNYKGIVRLLKLKLNQLTYTQRYSLATSLYQLGCRDYQLFEELDNAVKAFDAKKSVRDFWADLPKETKDYTKFVLNKLTQSDKVAVRLEEEFKVIEAEWDRELEVDFLSIQDYSNAKYVLMCADMGTGKNYCWDQSNVKHRMLVPLRSIVGQYGSDNNIHNHSITTYDQSVKLIELIDAKIINPREEILIIDEAHNFATAAFRIKALTNMFLLLKYDWKQVIFQSATISSNELDSIITFDIKIKASKRNAAQLNYARLQIASQTEQMQEAIKQIIKNKEHNIKSIVLFNDKDKLLELKDSIEQLSIHESDPILVEIVNAELTKDNTAIAYDLANNSNFKMNNIDVLIGTTSLVEGISIQDDIEQASAIVIGREPIQYIKQLCGRFRKAKTINCLHLAANYKDKDVLNIEDWIRQHEEDAIQTSKLIDFLENGTKNWTEAEHADIVISLVKIEAAFNQYALERNTNGYRQTSLYSLFISNKAIDKQMYSNFKFANNMLTNIGFNLQFADKTNSIEEIDNAVKESNKKVAKGLKQIRMEAAKPLLKIVKQCTDKNNSVDVHAVTKYFESTKLKSGKDTQQQLNTMLDVLNGLNSNAHTFNIVNTVIERMVKRCSNTKDLINWANAQVSTTGCIADIKRKFNKGTKLTVVQQNDTIADIVEQLVNDAVSTGLDKQNAFEYVMRQNRWRNVKDDIRLEDDTVVADLERPIFVLKHFIPNYKIKVTKVAGECVRLVEIID